MVFVGCCSSRQVERLRTYVRRELASLPETFCFSVWSKRQVNKVLHSAFPFAMCLQQREKEASGQYIHLCPFSISLFGILLPVVEIPPVKVWRLEVSLGWNTFWLFFPICRRVIVTTKMTVIRSWSLFLNPKTQNFCGRARA